MGARAIKGPAVPDMLIKFPLMLLMSVSMVAPFVSALELGVSLFTLIVSHAVFLGLWCAALRNRRTTLVSSALLLAAGAALVILYYTGETEGNFYTPLRSDMDSFFYWAGTYLRGYRMSNHTYALILVLSFSAFVCLPVCVFTVKKLHALFVALCGAACYVSLTIIGHIIDLPGLFAYILAATLYFLLQNYMRHAPAMRRSASPGVAAYLASALPLAALVLALTMLFSFALRIDPTWMKDVRDRVLKKGGAVNHAVSQLAGGTVIGTTELGGNVTLSDELLMEVDSPVGGLYLRGTSKNVYTGHSWEQKDTRQSVFYVDEGFPDTNETRDAIGLAGYDREPAGEILIPCEIGVRYAGMTTGLMYLPLKTMSIQDLFRFYRIGDDMLTLRDGNAPHGFEYRLAFLNMDYDRLEQSGIKDMIHKGFYQEKFDEAVNALAERQVDVLKAYRDAHGEDPNEAFVAEDETYMRIQADANTYNMLRINAAQIETDFLQLPPQLPERVTQLAKDITANETCDYDKALAIEAYLSQNYTYTLTPGNADKARDFVDQFLFVTKRGYCTYYATAMAVMLRSVGIPSRFVEGFLMPGGKTDGVYRVTKREAHAWVEAYFEGLGWMTFDPTTPFTDRRRQTEGPQASATPSPTPEPSLAPTPEPSFSAEPTDRPAAATPAGRIDWTLPLCLLGAAALLALAFAAPIRARAAMRGMAPKAAALRLFGQYLRLLAPQGIAMQDGETAARFAERVDGLMGFEGRDFQKAAEVFHIARFSPHAVTAEQKRQMLDFRRKLLRASRRRLGILRYLFYRYIWAA